MNNIEVSHDIIYIGTNDYDLDLFEGQYKIPNGISYNSYLIKDDKIAIMDTVDKTKKNEWLDNLDKVLNGESPDYLVVSHMEPDHAASIPDLIKKFPNIKIVGNSNTFVFLMQFFDIPELELKKIVVKEGDTLDLGRHTLKFIMAPMIHWPEVMVTYEQTEKILFTADAFGKFGTLDTIEDWECEARRYYFGIVGKYGMQVQMLLKKISKLNIRMICPLHGPILKDNLSYYLEKYNVWSSYEAEEKGIFIACASIHGNTWEVANKLKEILEDKGAEKVFIADLNRVDFSECIEDAFRYDKLVLASSTYNMNLFPPMAQFLYNLKERNYQNRSVSIIENGTWSPNAKNCMLEILSKMKNIELVEPNITIKSSLKTENIEQLKILATNILDR